MIPNKVKITGYKRFKNTSVCLDRKLIAFVGPNEAGKSSFFNALLSLENSNRYADNELTRESQFTDEDTIIRVEYLLDKEEKELLSKFNGKGSIRFYCQWKKVHGRVFHELIGSFERIKSQRNLLVSTIEGLLNDSRLKTAIEQTYENEDEELRSFEELLNEASSKIDLEIETMSEEYLELIEIIGFTISSKLDSFHESQKEILANSLESVNEFLKIEKAEHPKDRLLKYFDDNRPEFLIFSNEERFLEGEYSLDELRNPSPALSNLLHLAGVNSKNAVDIIENKKTGKRLKLQNDANQKLFNEFNDSWSQSEVCPQLIFDVDGLKIQISYIDTFTEIQERSDGLKQYIALKAFLASRDSSVAPVLLIDEAEIHLHYSAQSDLVNEFEKQKIVNSIIYTTHSAGCLPSDLGTGVRVVEPLTKNNTDVGLSIIKNSIWQNSGGFSPLLLAMGANIIAFTLARKAVIAEGPSETILLPRLMREITGLDYLDFQVAPGIAGIAKSNAKSFELEAAKVVYLVDGDEGGSNNRKKLKSGGIEQSKIIQLPQDCSIEDFVKSSILVEAIKREFETSGKTISLINIDEIPNKEKINWLTVKCKEANLDLPSKVKIAENISKTPSDEYIFDEYNKEALKRVYEKLLEELEK